MAQESSEFNLPKDVTLRRGLAPNESLGLMQTSGGGAHSGRGRTSFFTRCNMQDYLLHFENHDLFDTSNYRILQLTS